MKFFNKSKKIFVTACCITAWNINTTEGNFNCIIKNNGSDLVNFAIERKEYNYKDLIDTFELNLKELKTNYEVIALSCDDTCKNCSVEIKKNQTLKNSVSSINNVKNIYLHIQPKVVPKTKAPKVEANADPKAGVHKAEDKKEKTTKVETKKEEAPKVATKVGIPDVVHKVVDENKVDTKKNPNVEKDKNTEGRKCCCGR